MSFLARLLPYSHFPPLLSSISLSLLPLPPPPLFPSSCHLILIHTSFIRFLLSLFHSIPSVLFLSPPFFLTLVLLSLVSLIYFHFPTHSPLYLLYRFLCLLPLFLSLRPLPYSLHHYSAYFACPFTPSPFPLPPILPPSVSELCR